MNKVFNSFWSLLMIGALVVNMSCGKDEEVVPDAPSITFTGVADPTGITVNAGQTVSFVVKVDAPGGFTSMLVNKTVGTATTETYDLVPAPAGDSHTTHSYAFEYVTTAADAGKTVTFDFEATDNNGKKNRADFQIIVNDNPIVTYEAVLMGGQSNSTLGSFYNAHDNIVYMYDVASSTNDAVGNKGKVDFVFYYATSGTTPVNAVIAAPVNASARTAFDAALGTTGSLNGMDNETYFVRSTAAFGEVTTSTGIANAYTSSVSSTNPADTRITNLEANQVFAIMLSSPRGNRYALAQVVSVQGTSGADRKITLNIKAQTVNQ